MSGMRYNSSGPKGARESCGTWLDCMSISKAEPISCHPFLKVRCEYTRALGETVLSVCANLFSSKERISPSSPTVWGAYFNGRHMSWISSSNLIYLAKYSWQGADKTAVCALSVTGQGGIIFSLLSPDRCYFIHFFLLLSNIIYPTDQ